MKPIYSITASILAIVLFSTASVEAGEAPKSHSHSHRTPTADEASSPKAFAEAQAAVDTVDRFSAALKAGDLKTVESLLDPEVLILESGGAERNRQEYLSHHATSDAQFLKDAQIRLLNRTAKRNDDLAWVGSESEIDTREDGKPFALLSTETMVLKVVGGHWRIVHIHWSSRPKRS